MGEVRAVPATTLSRAAFDAVLFDLDGVLTDTALLHRSAWARLVEQELGGAPLTAEEYAARVDGRRREDGVRALMETRRVPVSDAAVGALARAKDGYFLELLDRNGPRLLSGGLRLVHAVRGAGMGCAVVSASRNCEQVLRRAGIGELFDVRVDGVVADELALPGKPHPATYLEAARRLGVEPHRAVVVEDAVAGVVAGRAGGFGMVLGVDRRGEGDGLRCAGADAVVADLSAVRVVTVDADPDGRPLDPGGAEPAGVAWDVDPPAT